MFAETKSLRFADFTLSPAKRTLFRERTEIKLRDKDFDVLAFLIESAPKTCSHDEIIKNVWNGTFVENGSVEKAIANIRKILGDDAGNPRFIKTIRSKGYLFIGDIKNDDLGTDNSENRINFPEIPIRKIPIRKTESKIPRKPHPEKNRKFLYVLFCLCVLVLFTATGIYFVGKFKSGVLFFDDFSGEEIDLQKWQAKGKSIRIADGSAIITIDETDKGGNLWSSYFSFDPTKPITISSRVKINPVKNFNKYYFQGEFVLIPKIFSREYEGVIDYDGIKRGNLAFGVFYLKHEYEAEEEIPTEGFFLIKPSGRPSQIYSQRNGLISKSIEPLWNHWFEQQIIYDPATGLMEYLIDGERKVEFNVGQMPPLDENKLQIQITPYGWYTNHSMEIDYIKITQ